MFASIRPAAQRLPDVLRKTDKAAYANLVTDLPFYFELRPGVVLMEIRSSERLVRRSPDACFPAEKQ
jgi:hypothetical protein